VAAAVLACIVAVLGIDTAAVCLNRPGHAGVGTTNWGWPVGFYDTEQVRTFESLNHIDPWVLATHTRAVVNGALRISDRMGQRQFRSLLMYDELFAPMEVEHQVVFSLPAPGRQGVLCVALNRARRDFSDGEIDRLEMLRRPLAAVVASATVLDDTVRGPDEPPKILTAREASVLDLLSAGCSNQQIGNRLGISVRTVDKHLENIYAKTGTRGRTSAAVWWLGLSGRARHGEDHRQPDIAGGTGQAIRKPT
jgi:DNA-binding CsgD family transcriptional regulator